MRNVLSNQRATDSAPLEGGLKASGPFLLANIRRRERSMLRRRRRQFLRDWQNARRTLVATKRWLDSMLKTKPLSAKSLQFMSNVAAAAQRSALADPRVFSNQSFGPE